MMKSNLKNLLLYLGIICLGLACNLDDGAAEIQLVPEKYELLFSYGEQSDLYQRKHLVDYFQLIALGTEYGQDFPFTKKWTKPMSIYLSGNSSAALLAELDTIIEELNPLFTDGFRIQLKEDSLEANFHIFLGDKETYGKMYPSTASLLKENDGLFTNYLNTDFSINHGHMFVEIYDNPLRFQKHILREELTQSLGLPNDIDYYANSIFYKRWTDVQAYSNLDIEVIRLLYHPQMIPKLGTESVTSILENILGL